MWNLGSFRPWLFPLKPQPEWRGLTCDGGVPADVADGLLLAVVQVSEGLILFEVSVGFATKSTVLLAQSGPVVKEHVHDLILLNGQLESPAKDNIERSKTNKHCPQFSSAENSLSPKNTTRESPWCKSFNNHWHVLMFYWSFAQIKASNDFLVRPFEGTFYWESFTVTWQLEVIEVLMMEDTGITNRWTKLNGEKSSAKITAVCSSRTKAFGGGRHWWGCWLWKEHWII